MSRTYKDESKAKTRSLVISKNIDLICLSTALYRAVKCLKDHCASGMGTVRKSGIRLSEI